MVTQAPTRGKVLTMVLFALSCFGLLVYLWTAFGGALPLAPHGYRFHVNFKEATQLAVQADVRISGVTVGHVVATQSGKRTTNTEIELDRRYAPLPLDTRAILRTKTLLGETYVELTPGSPGAPKLAEGGTLPDAQVQPTVELDEILRAFDRPTRRDFQRWLQSWSASLHARGQDVSDILGNAAPAAQDIDGVLGELDSQHGAVTRLVHDSGVVFGAIGAREGAVRTLIGSGDRVLRTTAADSAALTATLRILPTFLRELRPTLAVAEATAADAAPVVAGLRGPAHRLRSTLASLSALAPDARALFVEVDPLIALSKLALPALTEVVHDARPLVGELYPAGRELIPIVEYLGLYKREITTMWANVAAATEGVSRSPGAEHPIHYIRTLTPFTNEGSVTYPHRLPSNRHNPYFLPGGLEHLATGLESFDCANESNAQGPLPSVSFPPCKTQPPLQFRGLSSSFPHLERDAP
jgi:phospholipid/cholesterol/gamma-HCH transport system substrate-binding protein